MQRTVVWIGVIWAGHAVLSGKVKLGNIISGTTWFIAMDLLTLLILIAFPAISLFLPSLMAQ